MRYSYNSRTISTNIERRAAIAEPVVEAVINRFSMQ